MSKYSLETNSVHRCNQIPLTLLGTQSNVHKVESMVIPLEYTSQKENHSPSVVSKLLHKDQLKLLMLKYVLAHCVMDIEDTRTVQFQVQLVRTGLPNLHMNIQDLQRKDPILDLKMELVTIVEILMESNQFGATLQMNQ